MTVWDFANANPGMALLMLFLVVMLIRSIGYRTARTLSIRKSGWPPAHLDADGDFKDCDCDEDKQAA
jgi:hypothetical protein